MKYVIAGRVGTGKDTFAHMLSEKLDLTVLKTHTDRPKRYPGEDSYIFHTKEEAAAIPKRFKLLYTRLADGERFTTKEDVEHADVLILDPSGFYEFCSLFPDEVVYLIYVTANPAVAREHAGKRHEDATTGIRIYDDRYFQESVQFENLEKQIRMFGNNPVDETTSGQGKQWPENCMGVYGLKNDFNDMDDMEEVIRMIEKQRILLQNTMSLVCMIKQQDCVYLSSDQKIRIALNNSPGFQDVTNEMFAATLLADQEGMHTMMKALLQTCDPFESKQSITDRILNCLDYRYAETEDWPYKKDWTEITLYDIHRISQFCKPDYSDQDIQIVCDRVLMEGR